MKRYATRLRVRLSMPAAMLAFLPGRAIAELCNECDVAGRRGNVSEPHPRFIRYPLGCAPGRRSGAGFDDERLRAVYCDKFDRREALRPFGRGRDCCAAMGQRAEAFA